MGMDLILNFFNTRYNYKTYLNEKLKNKKLYNLVCNKPFKFLFFAKHIISQKIIFISNIDRFCIQKKLFQIILCLKYQDSLESIRICKLNSRFLGKLIKIQGCIVRKEKFLFKISKVLKY